MSSGWIKLHRALLDWEWFSTPNMVHFWVYCLLKANHEPKQWQGIIIERGQFVAGRESLSANIGISERSVRTCIERLKTTDEMTSKSYAKYTVFTINSWEKYQSLEDGDKQNDQQTTSKRPANDQQTTTNKNEKNYKNEKNNTYRFIRPELEEVVVFFESKKSNRNEAIKFFAYYDSNGWKVGKNTMKKWTSAAIGWISRNYTEPQTTAIAGTKERDHIPNGRIEYVPTHSCKYCVAVSLRLGLKVDDADSESIAISRNPVTQGEIECVKATFKSKPDMLKYWNEQNKSPYKGML